MVSCITASFTITDDVTEYLAWEYTNNFISHSMDRSCTLPSAYISVHNKFVLYLSQHFLTYSFISTRIYYHSINSPHVLSCEQPKHKLYRDVEIWRNRRIINCMVLVDRRCREMMKKLQKTDQSSVWKRIVQFKWYSCY